MTAPIATDISALVSSSGSSGSWHGETIPAGGIVSWYSFPGLSDNIPWIITTLGSPSGLGAQIATVLYVFDSLGNFVSSSSNYLGTPKSLIIFDNDGNGGTYYAAIAIAGVTVDLQQPFGGDSWTSAVTIPAESIGFSIGTIGPGATTLTLDNWVRWCTGNVGWNFEEFAGGNIHNGLGPVAFTLDTSANELPAGLLFDCGNGVISGVPQAKTTGDSYFHNVVLQLYWDSLDDVSNYKHITTFEGAVQPIPDESFLFSGGNINWAPASSFVLGTNDFTVEFWCSPESLAQSSVLYDGRDTYSQNGLLIWLNTDGNLHVGGLTDAPIVVTSPLTTGYWWHITVSRTSAYVRVYIDGEIASEIPTVTSINLASPCIRMGNSVDNANPFNGYISDIRITNGTARYSTSFALAPWDSITFGITATDVYGNSVNTTFLLSIRDVLPLPADPTEVVSGQIFMLPSNQQAGEMIGQVLTVGGPAYDFVFTDGLSNSSISDDGRLVLSKTGQLSLTSFGAADSGMNTVGSSFTYHVKVKGGDLNWAGFTNITIQVTEAPPLVVTTLLSELVTAQYGTTISATPVGATGGTLPYTYSFDVYTYHPEWMVINSMTGSVTGVASVSSVGIFDCAITVTDATGNSGTAPFKINIVPESHAWGDLFVEDFSGTSGSTADQWHPTVDLIGKGWDFNVTDPSISETSLLCTLTGDGHMVCADNFLQISPIIYDSRTNGVDFQSIVPVNNAPSTVAVQTDISITGDVSSSGPQLIGMHFVEPTGPDLTSNSHACTIRVHYTVSTYNDGYLSKSISGNIYQYNYLDDSSSNVAFSFEQVLTSVDNTFNIRIRKDEQIISVWLGDVCIGGAESIVDPALTLGGLWAQVGQGVAYNYFAVQGEQSQIDTFLSAAIDPEPLVVSYLLTGPATIHTDVISAVTPVGATGGTLPYTYSIAPTLPSPIAFSTATGTVSNTTPTGTDISGNYTITVTDVNGQTGSLAFDLKIINPSSHIPIVPHTWGNFFVEDFDGAAGAQADQWHPRIDLNGKGWNVANTDANVNLVGNGTVLGVAPGHVYHLVPALYKEFDGQKLIPMDNGPSVVAFETEITIGADRIDGYINYGTQCAIGVNFTSQQGIASPELIPGNMYTVFAVVRHISLMGGLSVQVVFGMAGEPLAAHTTHLNSQYSGTVKFRVTIDSQVIALYVNDEVSMSVASTLDPQFKMASASAITTGEIINYFAVQAEQSQIDAFLSPVVVPEPLAVSYLLDGPIVGNSGESVNLVPVGATGGVLPYVYSITPTLPVSMSFDAEYGTISGFYTTTSSLINYAITVTDSAGQVGSQQFPITTIAPAPPPTIPDLELDQILGLITTERNEPVLPVSTTRVTGGVAPYSYSLTPELPSGLTFDNVTGKISGKITMRAVDYEAYAGTNTQYTITVTDSTGNTAHNLFTLAIPALPITGDRIWRIDAISGTNLGTLTERRRVDLTLPVINYVGVTFRVISGALPAGLRIEGHSIVGTTFEVPKVTTSTFVVRASIGNIISDRTFTLNVEGADAPQWITPAGDLDVNHTGQTYVLDSTVVDYQLSVIDSDLSAGQQLEFFIEDGDGELPPGLTLSDSGKISGIIDPVLAIDIGAGSGYFDSNAFGSEAFDFGSAPTTGLDTLPYDSFTYDYFTLVKAKRRLNRNYAFIVTVTDGVVKVRRTFKLYVVSDDFLRDNPAVLQLGSGVFTTADVFLRPVVWLSPNNLGIKRANNYATISLDVFDPRPETGPVVYQLEPLNTDLSASKLPTGMYLDPTNGEIFGYIPYQPAVTREYKFTVTALKYDAATYSTVNVTFDTIETAIAGQTFLKIQPLPNAAVNLLVGDSVRIGSSFYTITEYMGESITGGDYVLLYVETPLLIDIPRGTSVSKTYAQDTVDTTVMRATKTFVLNVLGEVESVIQWTTPNDLGTIRANFPSTLQMVATTSVPNAKLSYRLVGGSLPPGLTLTANGDLVGHVRQFGDSSTPGLTTFDSGTTKFDGGTTTLDRRYTFYILAEDQYKYSGITGKFTVFVNAPDERLYSNIFVKPLQRKEKRAEFYSFITNTGVFTPDKIYRLSDPAFGVQDQLKMLLYAGIETALADDYMSALGLNTKKKRFLIGSPKKAVAKQYGSNEIEYEVIYLEMIDEYETDSKSVANRIRTSYGFSAPVKVNQTGQDTLSSTEIFYQPVQTHDPISVDSTAVKASGNNIEYVYPSSVTNMRNNISNIKVPTATGERGLITEHEFLPLWMLTPQSSTAPATGFIKAVPICYCKPGQADYILDNIRNSGFDFTSIDYEIDRFIIDITTGNSTEQYLKFGNRKTNI